MGTYDHNYRSTYKILRGVWGLLSTDIKGVTSTHEPPSMSDVRSKKRALWLHQGCRQ